ncbi:hypothetical protein JCM1840_003552 [Sporobolomyces johnsonii]
MRSFGMPSADTLVPLRGALRSHLLNAIHLPHRISAFVAAWRTHFISPSSELALLYPPSTPYALTSADFEVVSSPDPLSPSAANSPTWVRVPALSPTLDGLPASARARIGPLPALPAMGSSDHGRSIVVHNARWEFEKLGPELDTSFWDVVFSDSGIGLKVTFDQAFRAVGPLA